jgi:hypothetical protein
MRKEKGGYLKIYSNELIYSGGAIIIRPLKELR